MEADADAHARPDACLRPGDAKGRSALPRSRPAARPGSTHRVLRAARPSGPSDTAEALSLRTVWGQSTRLFKEH